MSASASDSVLGMGIHVNGKKKKPVNLSWRRREMLLIDPQGHWQRVLLVWVEEEIPSSFFQERTAQSQKCSKKKKNFLM